MAAAGAVVARVESRKSKVGSRKSEVESRKSKVESRVVNRAGEQRRALVLAGAALAVFVVVMVLLELVAPRLAFFAPYPVLGSLLVATVFLGAAGSALALAIRLPLPAWVAGAVLVVAAAADVAIVLLAGDSIPSPWAEIALNLVLLVGAVAAGGLLARVIGDLSRAVPVCLVIIVVDLWSVFAPSGVTRKIVESFESGESMLLGFLLASFPVPGLENARSGLGVTDLVFVAAFLGLLGRARLPVRGSLLAILAALLVTIVLGGLLALPVPALPLIAVAFWAVNFRSMRMATGEKLQTALFVAALILVLGGYSLIAHGLSGG